MLARPLRVRQTNEWQRLHRHGQAVHLRDLSLKFAPNQLPHPRFGFMVGNTVSKQATVRNRTKRQLRAICRQLTPRVRPGYDCIIMTRRGAVTLTYPQLQTQVVHLLTRARLYR